MARARDKQLLEALTRAYTVRSQLFHSGVKAAKIDLLIAEIDSIDETELDWSEERLAISPSALAQVRGSGGRLHQVFAHPDIMGRHPHLIAYYRNIVTISKKGIGQILFSTEAYESGRRKEIGQEDALVLCQTLNRIISGVIDKTPDYKVELSRQAIVAEIGTELQGTWANTVGQGAAKAVEQVFDEYIALKAIGKKTGHGEFELKNGWTIRFGAEPDVVFLDGDLSKQIAIEIKGSLDVAGAQTRYGEAKKSFAKQLADNPRCHTIYLASCFTDAVIHQIQVDAQVRDWFNLTSILYDEHERRNFLGRLFHVVDTPRR